MRGLILSIAAFALAGPLVAQPLDASMLRSRLAGIEMRIDALQDRHMLSPAETQDLHAQARDVERRLHGMSAGDAADIQTRLGRLERRVGYSMEDARRARHVYGEGEDRHVDEHRYERDPHPDYRNFDRYTAPPVDRWHDPFDRGCCL